jgi:hypothetical protein
VKRGRSTGKPTAEESAWIVAIKEGRCVACYLRAQFNDGCDAHHLLSGGRRRGHLFTIGLCAWHHRGVPDMHCTVKEMRELFGVSLMDGSKLFRDAYGTDDELLQLQKEVLGYA